MYCMKSRNRYMELLRLKNQSNDIIDENLSPITMDDQTDDLEAELRVFEDTLPLQALIVFRQLVALEAVSRMRARQKLELEKKLKDGTVPTSSSWWGWGSSRQSVDKSIVQIDRDGNIEEDMSLEYLNRGLGVGTDSTPVSSQDELMSNNMYLVRFGLESSATLDLYVDGFSIAVASMALQIDAEVHAKSTTAVFSLKNLTMIDLITSNPIIRNVIAVQKHVLLSSNAFTTPSQEGSKPMTRVVFDSRDGKATCRIFALPLEITWNTLCVQRLLEMFLYRTSALRSPVRSLIVQRQSKTSTSASTGGIDVYLEIEAPKLIFPEDSSVDKGYVLLDTGHLAVSGNMSPNGMWWEVSLKAVNAGLPLTLDDMYRFGEQSLYLIKPFNISLSAQNIEKSIADMTVSIRVDPEVRGELDASKLARLLTVVQIVSLTFLRAMRGERDDVVNKSDYNNMNLNNDNMNNNIQNEVSEAEDESMGKSDSSILKDVDDYLVDAESSRDLDDGNSSTLDTSFDASSSSHITSQDKHQQQTQQQQQQKYDRDHQLPPRQGLTDKDPSHRTMDIHLHIPEVR